jgi:hypothetical protein
VLDAAHSNLLLVASVPLVVALWLLWTRSRWTGAPGPRVPARLVRPLLLAAVVLTVAFTVYRNTPWGSAWHAA